MVDKVDFHTRFMFGGARRGVGLCVGEWLAGVAQAKLAFVYLLFLYVIDFLDILGHSSALVGGKWSYRVG